jgi:hypothetical protein
MHRRSGEYEAEPGDNSECKKLKSVHSIILSIRRRDRLFSRRHFQICVTYADRQPDTIPLCCKGLATRNGARRLLESIQVGELSANMQVL